VLRVIYALWCSILCCPLTALADEVLFKNGDRLQGRIVSMDAGELEIESTVAGTVKVPMAEVATFQTDEIAEVHFDDGTVVRQPIATGDPGSIQLAPGGMVQVQPFALDRIEEINPPPGGPKWDLKITGAYEVNKGNTENSDAFAEVRLERETELDEFMVRARYRAKRETDEDTGNESTSERRYTARTQYNFKLTPIWYGYTNASGEKDGPSDIDLRAVLGAGLGYRWFNTETTQIRFELGPSWVSENYSDATPDDNYVSSRFAWMFSRKLKDAITLFHDMQWLLSVEDTNDQIFNTETGFRAELSDHVFAEAKVLWDWDSSPAQDSDRTDVSYIMGLGLDF
jgi:putative salt-induced outer membrane protein YdiY